MTPDKGTPDPHAAHNGITDELKVVCYVCEEDLTAIEPTEKDKPERASKLGKKGEKAKLKPGLVEISAEGTGFAGGGQNMAKREGVAFQC